MVDTSRLMWQKPRRQKTSIELFKYADHFIEVKPGQVIFDEGDTGDCMYIVKSGRVDLYVGRALVEQAGPGDVFGEMVLLDECVRSARAVAAESCQLVPLTQDDFDRLVSRGPYFARELLRLMAVRLRRANAELRAIVAQSDGRAPLPPAPPKNRLSRKTR